MSTSLLYHGFRIRGYRYRKTDYIEGSVVFTIEQDRNTFRCTACGSADVESRGKAMRVFQNVPIGSMPTFVHFAVPKVLCRACGVWRQLTVGFADPKRRHTRAFERYALELTGSMTISDAAKHLGVGWDRIKDFQKRYLKRHYAKPRLKDLRQIAIDEIAIGGGHRYLTVVLDLETGAIVFVGKGKDAKALEPFWRRLIASGATVEAVATDMSRAYIFAVRQALPKAVHVFDRFHVVRLLNETLTKLRQALYHELTDKLHLRVLKGIRWLLLKNFENLDDDRNEQQRLYDALQLNQPLALAYYLKEDLRQFWKQPDKRTASRFLNDWIRRANATGIAHMQKFATTMAMYRTGLLAYYDYPITTGPLEGTNNKIKTMKRQAYGYRDQEFFELKLFALHQTKYALIG